MIRRIFSSILFLITLSITIWQLIVGQYWWLIAILALISGIFLFVTIFPLLRWGYHMIRTIWRAWRYPDRFFFIRNICMNLLPHPSEPGRGFEWICDFDVISILPWSKKMNFELEIREPSEIAGTNGNINGKMIEKLSSTKIDPHRYPLSKQAHDFLVARVNESPFLPTRILITGRNDKGKFLFSESIRYVIQW